MLGNLYNNLKSMDTHFEITDREFLNFYKNLVKVFQFKRKQINLIKKYKYIVLNNPDNIIFPFIEFVKHIITSLKLNLSENKDINSKTLPLKLKDFLYALCEPAISLKFAKIIGRLGRVHGFIGVPRKSLTSSLNYLRTLIIIKIMENIDSIKTRNALVHAWETYMSIVLEIMQFCYLSHNEHLIKSQKKELEFKDKELKKTQSVLASTHQQLIHSARMASIGTLAGGLAHNFNNILVGILGYASLIKEMNSINSRIYKYADIIENSAMRAAEMTARLLSFARKNGKNHNLKPTDVNKVIIETLELLKASFPASIEIATILTDNLPLCMANPSELQQVILNLCLNSKDAMPNGGQLTIITTELPFRSKTSSRYILISIKDTGIGIDKKNIDKIFDPFFSTKSKDKGLGIGLSTVYATISSYGGNIEVISSKNKGTEIKLIIPAIKEKVSLKQPVDIPRGSNETILVIDDEPMVLEFIKSVLKVNGYNVICAKSGLEGLKKYQANRKKIDAIIIDIIMPGMSGKNLFKKIKKLNKNMRIIITSGFVSETDLNELFIYGLDGFIKKPFKPEELIKTLAIVLKKQPIIG